VPGSTYTTEEAVAARVVVLPVTMLLSISKHNRMCIGILGICTDPSSLHHTLTAVVAMQPHLTLSRPRTTIHSSRRHHSIHYWNISNINMPHLLDRGCFGIADCVRRYNNWWITWLCIKWNYRNDEKWGNKFK
jgi:hypothetical protein